MRATLLSVHSLICTERSLDSLIKARYEICIYYEVCIQIICIKPNYLKTFGERNLINIEKLFNFTKVTLRQMRFLTHPYN